MTSKKTTAPAWYSERIGMSGTAVSEYLVANASYQHDGDNKGFWVVHKEMRVFKRTVSSRDERCGIVELALPVGTLIYALGRRQYTGPSSTSRKMRASRAVVVAQWRANHVSTPPVQWNKMRVSYSPFTRRFSNKFKYSTGEAIVPLPCFSRDREQCAAGIHFFINLRDALTW